MSRGPGMMTGLIVGGLIGAGLALLLAPRPGREVRRNLVEWRQARRELKPAADPAAEVLDLSLAVVEASRSRFEHAMAAARQASREAAATLATEWEQAKRRNGQHP